MREIKILHCADMHLDSPFEALGEKDACGGYAQRTKESFIEWGKRELIDPVGKDHPIVELMYLCYMDGYNAGRAQNEG